MHITDSTTAPVNQQDLIQRCMGNLEFVERIISKFVERFGDDLEELEQGFIRQDAESVAAAAHRIKGASANVSAEGLREVSEQIETAARAGQLGEVSDCVAQLRKEWSRFMDYTDGLEITKS